ncbi:PucR family transcriptional regulator [Kribbella kalugense]|uniref:DNA-binding PucR family transcriptional regulator n=1 Tax=Kribbella kalugense TaxID=2512221 RepID=A0A4R8A567_9ACTN|nr:helix-turn-helix domain-containing protein [Kribbella kalugense]TDW24638.1 DNA-binding PucR family transcriptional regulator [Kribbella kalugense]
MRYMPLRAQPTLALSAGRVLGSPRAASLAQILEHLGTTVLELVSGDPDLADPPREVVFFDPSDPAPVPRGAILIGTGLRSTEDGLGRLIRAAATARAAALILPAAVVSDSPEAIRAADEAGLVVLSLSAGTTWQQLSALLESAVRDTVRPVAVVPSRGEGLFRLANAICTLIDAPVTIEDRNAAVLAFSDRQEEADFIRIDCILGRRTIEPYLRVDEDRGAVRAIRRSPVPVYLDAVRMDDARPTLPRLAMAIRAGDEFLGTIWAVVPGPPTPEQEQLLLEASRAVALQMLRSLGTDPEQRTTSELVAAALAGDGEALTRLGLAGTPCLVLAAALAQPSSAELVGTPSGTLARRVRERERTASALRVELAGTTPGTVVAVVNDQVYALVPARRADETATQVEQTCRVFAQQHQAGEPLRIGIGRVAGSAAGVRLSRADADRAVRVLQDADGGRCVAKAFDVEVEALLIEARELVALRGRGPSGALARLLAYDDARNATMVETLRAWLDAQGDVVPAAEQTHVHENTFRYRLRRISEIGGFDLEDADARFALDLQLRLFPQAQHDQAQHDQARHDQAPHDQASNRRKTRPRTPSVEYPSSTPA